MCVLGDEGIYSGNDDDLFRYATVSHSTTVVFPVDRHCCGRGRGMTGCDINRGEGVVMPCDGVLDDSGLKNGGLC